MEILKAVQIVFKSLRIEFIVFCFFLTLKIGTAFAQPVIFEKPLSPRIANYEIDVVLNTDNNTIQGEERLTWHNTSNDIISELQFHLYWNAFRNNKSTYMKEAGRRFHNSKMKEENLGFININRIALENKNDLSGTFEFIHPDDDNVEDKTVFRLPLPKPIQPGEAIVVEIDFTARLSEPPLERTGTKEEYFFVAQWFPKVGVYIDGEWNCHQYHKDSEFFADFGVYDVRMTVPAKNTVAATGIEVNVKNNGDGTATHYYRAEDVHDFAWCTSPEFVEFRDKAQGVDIRVLMQPDRAAQGQRHVDAAKVAIEYFHNWYGEYPYPNLTVIDPRRGAMATGGMEYPTLITAGTHYFLPAGVRLPEMVIIHEFGHQYWYGMVASNEFEEPWLDEGINSFSEQQIFHDFYGPEGDIIDILGIKINDLQFQRGSFIFFSDIDPIVKPAWEFYSSGSYGVSSYQKPALMLTTLQNYLGAETMQKILRAYFERWKFKHPKTGDFIQVANEISGQDLDWFFQQALFSNKALDYSVSKIISWEIKPGKGFDYTFNSDSNFQNSEIMADTIKTSIDSLISDRADSAENEDSPNIYFSEVTIRRLGDFIFPVTIEIRFEDGEKIHEKWDGRELWKRFIYQRTSRLRSVEIDPERQVPIDIDYTNNSQMLKKDTTGIHLFAMKYLTWMQLIFDQPMFLNMFTGFAMP